MRCLLAVLCVPLLAQQDVNLFSVEKERALGEAIAADIRRGSDAFTHPAVAEYVNRIAARLNTAGYRFEIIKRPGAMEPMCVPGGHVFIPSAFFLAANDEHEFAGMLAHCIGHIALRHGTRSASRGKLVNISTIPLIFLGGSHADTRSSSVSIPHGFLPFHREQELEADIFGLDLAARAGFDPAGLRRYIERMQPAEWKPTSAVPPRETRLARINERLATLSPVTAAASGDFAQIQQLVREALPVPDPPAIRPPRLRR